MSDKQPKKDTQPNDDAHHTDGNEGGIGCSEMAYYKALMKGGRVTRNRIRKEEDPPATPEEEPKKAEKLLSTKKLLLKKPQL
jgi:hypothetical protein